MAAENEKQQKAFELYYALGEKRTYGRAAERLGVSTSTIKHWSRTFGWRRRVQERDADIARQIADKVIQSTVDDLERNQRIVRMALMRVAKAIADGSVRTKIGDLGLLIHLQAFLDKEESSRGSQVMINGRLVPMAVLSDEELCAELRRVLDEAAECRKAHTQGKERCRAEEEGPGRRIDEDSDGVG